VSSTFIFVHGGFGSPAELAPTIPYLESMGHRVLNVDLPSEQADATLEDYASTVVQVMVETSGPRILVAHSAGGATIPLVAAQTPVDRIVYVAAVVPQPGQSIYDAIGAETQVAIMSVSVDNGDGTRSFDFDLLASLIPEDKRQAYLEFLRATQRKQGMKAMYQPWPGSTTTSIASKRSRATLLISAPNGFSMITRRFVSRYCQHHGLRMPMMTPGNRGSRIRKYSAAMKGIDARAISRPSVTGTPKIRGPISKEYNRPKNRPAAVAESDGQTTIFVTSLSCEGATPAMGWIMKSKLSEPARFG
jgi:pimeloyl-ACP methyl ester carboxylesterase